jgi:hypothetical protein
VRKPTWPVAPVINTSGADTVMIPLMNSKEYEHNKPSQDGLEADICSGVNSFVQLHQNLTRRPRGLRCRTVASSGHQPKITMITLSGQ